MQFEKFNDSAKVNTQSKIDIIYFADLYKDKIIEVFTESEYNLKFVEDIKLLQQIAQNLSINQLNTSILLEINTENQAAAEEFVKVLKSNWLTRNLIVIFLVSEDNPTISKNALQLGVSDCYLRPFPFEDVRERLNFLSFYKLLRSQVTNLSEVYNVEYKSPLGKRFLDVFLSSIALICISPLLILVAILIKLDSKGPVFYVSKRVGTGYKIFDFYKFRSMRTGADAEVKNLAKENQYGDSAFFKLKNDPRVTKLGNFLRNTSIDELPQLVNVIKGDMSLVGNRPLPLYEAEQLTTNEWSMRFLGPAGLTGLWQISKRGKKDMSERERKKLDNFYASNYSIWLDLKIILKTIPALLQKEKV